MFRKYFCLMIILGSVMLRSGVLWACESCAIARLGRDGAQRIESQNKNFFFEYLFEQQNWHEKEAAEAHGLHHQGHHFHDKTREDLHHFTFGANLAERVTVLTEIPYVIRHSIEIDDHSILGTRQRSEGVGDLNLIGMFELWNQNRTAVSLLGGVKFPTGATDELNTIGTRFEPELQPGSGSFDYIVGGVYKRDGDRQAVTANVSYVFKNEGAQDFEYGDVLTLSGVWEYKLNPLGENWQANVGLDTSFQYEQKQKEAGETMKDSGGFTWLLGPAVSLGRKEGISFNAAFLLPAYQNLGGVHQTLDYVWTAGGKIAW